MRVIHVLASSGGVGGLEQHTFNLVNELSKTIQVSVIGQACYQSYFNQNVDFHALDFKRSRWNLSLLWQLTKTIKSIKPDIVHAQAGKASQLIARIRPCLGKVKFVSTIHGTKKNKSAYLAADQVIAVSRALADGIDKEKVNIIYNGVYQQAELDQASIKTLQQDVYAQFPHLDRTQKVLICIGRLEPVKNIALLLKCMPALDAQLWVVGDGSLRAQLEALTVEYNLDNKVAFLGYRQDARELMQLADVVVLSSDREGFPLVMVESLQANKVMASTRVNGVVEWIPESYLAPISDVKALTQAIDSALKPQAKDDFKSLFLRARNELTVEAMTAQTLKLYQKVLANQAKS